MNNNPLYLRLISYLSSIFLIPILSSCTFLRNQDKPNLKQIAQGITVGIFHQNQLGSGILIAQKENTYQVLTNAHIAQAKNASYRIQTTNGQTYPAQVIHRSNTFEGKDLALLEFESTADYQTAELGNRQSLRKQQTVLVAGFQSQQQEIAFSKGKIALLPESPLKGGYQIGYDTKIQKGMIGGPLLNEAGEVIGVNGVEQVTGLEQNNTVEQDSSSSQQQRKALNQTGWSIPIQVSCLAKINPKLVPEQVDEIAQGVTVRIDQKEKEKGSGVIVAHEGDTYWVLTAVHVVNKQGNYQVVTIDNKKHSINYKTVKSPKGIDLALLQFNSPKKYSVANLGDYYLGSIEERPLIFLSGFPKTNPEQRNFTAGNTFPQVATPHQVKNRYSLGNGSGLVYTNFSQQGMSGGPVFDTYGRIIGIHTKSEAEIFTKNEKINLGYSLGVPVRTFLGVASKIPIPTQSLQVKKSAPPRFKQSEAQAITESLFTAKAPSKEATALDWLNYGNRLWRIDKVSKAVNAFERAIELRPNFYQAYYTKGKALFTQGDNLRQEERKYQAAEKKFEKSLTAFEQATSIDPNFYEAWRDRAEVLTQLERPQEALTSINKAIEKNSKDFILHYHRGEILLDLGRLKEAEAAHSKAISLHPSAWTYLFRGITRTVSQDYKGAIADFNKAIELQPKFAIAYSARSTARIAIGKEKAALADVNQALELHNYAGHYLAKGLVYFTLGNYEQAVADFTKVIKRDPFEKETIYNAYVQRANSHKKLGNYPQAIDDFHQASNLLPDRTLAYTGQAKLHFDQNNYQQAIKDYTKVIELQPNNANVYSSRAFAYTELGKKRKAAADYKQALEIYIQRIENNPNNAQAYLGRANLVFQIHTRFQLGDRQTVIQVITRDLQKAAKLFQKKDNQRGYQLAQNLLKRLQSMEN